MSNDHEVTIPWWAHDIADDWTQDRTFWVTGGLGSGKTWGTCLWHIIRCFDNADAPVSWSVAPTFPKAEAILAPTFREVLQDVFGMQENVDFKITYDCPLEIRLFETNQTIYLHSANRYHLMVGESISHFSATEVGYYPNEEWFIKCKQRLRSPKAKVRQACCEGTPEGFNWYQKYADFEDFDEVRNFKRMILHSDDNPHLPDGYIENNIVAPLAHDPGRLESYRYGRFVPFTKGTAYWEFFHSRNVVSDVKPSQYLPLIFTWDFGVTPLAWVAMQRQQHRTRLGIQYQRFTAIAEGSGKARGVLDGCAEFIKAFDPSIYRDTPIEIDGGQDGYSGSWLTPSCAYDQIHQVLTQYYRNVTIVAARAAPTIESRLNKVNALLAYERYVISSQCQNLIKSHAQTALKDGTWQLDKKGNNDPSHFSDAACHPLFRLAKDEHLINPNTKMKFGTNKVF